MILNDRKSIEKIDKSNMLGLIENFDRQCKEAGCIKIPSIKKKQYDFIILSGMGGSAIAGDILKILVEMDSSVPFIVHRDYGLPGFIGKNSLVLAVSYSGNTEETISAYKQAVSRGATVCAISSGGEIEKLASTRGMPHIKIPSGQPPRCSLGYLFFPLEKLLYTIGVIKQCSSEKISNMALSCRENYGIDKIQDNKAKEIASLVHNKNVVVYSGNTLSPSALRWKTQLSENSKHIASVNYFPEMNHNEIMAWNYPDFVVKNSVIFFFYDKGDNKRVKLRMDLTSKIIGVKSLNIQKLNSYGKSTIERIFSLIILGDWVSFYLAILNGVDPTEIKEISYLKKELSLVE